MDIAAFYQGLAEFFDGQFLTILAATLLLFCIMFVTWWVYRTLSRCNIFILKDRKDPTPVTGWDHFKYIMKYFFIFPIYTFIGFIIFAFSLFTLMRPTSVDQQTTILFVAIVMVSTIRVCAHVNEQLAEDFAKLMPLTMLSVLLLHPTLDGIGITLAQTQAFLMLIPGFLKYLIFTIILEALLRGGAFIIAMLRTDKAGEIGKSDS